MLLNRKRSPEPIGALSAAIAAAVVLVCSSSANAALVYSGVMNIPIPISGTGLFVNVETNQVAGDFTPAPAGWDVNVYGTSATSLNFWGGSTGTVYMRQPGVFTGFNVASIPAGTSIGVDNSFATNPTAVFTPFTQGHWSYNAINAFGFRFISGAGGYRYGWMRIAVGANALERAIVDWGYDDGGGSASADVVPGPATLAVAAMGLLCGRSRRRSGLVAVK